MIEQIVMGALYGAVIGVAIGRVINWSIGVWNVYTAGPHKEMWVAVTPSHHNPQPIERRC